MHLHHHCSPDMHVRKVLFLRSVHQVTSVLRNSYIHYSIHCHGIMQDKDQGPRTKDQHDLVRCEELFVVDQDDGDLSGCMFMQI